MKATVRARLTTGGAVDASTADATRGRGVAAVFSWGSVFMPGGSFAGSAVRAG